MIQVRDEPEEAVPPVKEPGAIHAWRQRLLIVKEGRATRERTVLAIPGVQGGSDGRQTRRDGRALRTEIGLAQPAVWRPLGRACHDPSH